MKKSKSVKKTPVPAKAGKTAAPAKKAAAKPVAKKSPVKKAASVPKKIVAKAKPASKKPVAKKAAKAAPAPKAAAKPVKAAAKAPVKKAPAPAPKAKAAAVAAGVKHASPVKETAKPVEVKEVPAVTPAKAAAKPVKVKAEKLSKADKAKAAAAAAPAEAFAALDPSVKRPAKPFFLEVKPGVERVIKRGDKSAASPVLDIQARRKGPAAEESSEELAERIERELQSQSFLKRNRMRPQLCTKCGINAVAPRFTIDRELGYCDPCAEILHLGETKEARRMEFNLALKKEEGAEEAASDEPEGPSPDEVEDVPDDE